MSPAGSPGDALGIDGIDDRHAPQGRNHEAPRGRLRLLAHPPRGVAAGVADAGKPLLGQTRTLYIQAPSAPSTPYLLAASTATAPGIPSLAGADVSFAFVALDVAQPCPVVAVSAPTTVTLL